MAHKKTQNKRHVTRIDLSASFEDITINGGRHVIAALGQIRTFNEPSKKAPTVNYRRINLPKIDAKCRHSQISRDATEQEILIRKIQIVAERLRRTPDVPITLHSDDMNLLQTISDIKGSKSHDLGINGNLAESIKKKDVSTQFQQMSAEGDEENNDSSIINLMASANRLARIRINNLKKHAPTADPI